MHDEQLGQPDRRDFAADWSRVKNPETYDAAAREAAETLLGIIGIPSVTERNHLWAAERIRAWDHACTPITRAAEPAVRLRDVQTLIGLRTNGPRLNRADWLKRLAGHMEDRARHEVARELAELMEAHHVSQQAQAIIATATAVAHGSTQEGQP